MRKMIVVLGIMFSVNSFAADDVLISSCVNKITKDMRHINAPQTCKRTEYLLSWNQKGPQGIQGLPGEIGPAGPTGPAGPGGVSYEPCQTLDFAGKWLSFGASQRCELLLDSQGTITGGKCLFTGSAPISESTINFPQSGPGVNQFIFYDLNGGSANAGFSSNSCEFGAQINQQSNSNTGTIISVDYVGVMSMDKQFLHMTWNMIGPNVGRPRGVDYFGYGSDGNVQITFTKVE